MDYSDQIRTEQNAKVMRELIADGIEENKSIADSAVNTANSKGDQAISIANTASTTANTANDRVDNIITAQNGQTPVEVIDSRYDNITGTTYNNLGERLDNHSLGLADIKKNKVYGTDTVNDNSTDNYTAINNMFKNAATNYITDATISSNSFLTKSIDLPNGVYRVKQPNLLLDALSVRAQNLVVDGHGATIVFEGFEGYCFEINDTYMNVDFYNITFISANDATAPNRSFFKNTSNGGTQAIRFHQCTFNGKVLYGLDLHGTNCNSEMVFNQCSWFGNWTSFLYIGPTDTNDMFVNYWFNNCKYWCSANWITAYKGGHFKLNHCDVSGYQPSVDTYLFKLLGGSHAGGVQTFIDDGTRYELKTPQAKVIQCEWDTARVSFENSDMSGNAFNSIARNDYFYFKNLTDGTGSNYTFTNCNILGKFKLESSTASELNNLYIKEGQLFGDSSTTSINDIFTYVTGPNLAEFIKVNLTNTKFLSTMYNKVLNIFSSSFSTVSLKATITQSPQATLLSSWTYPITQTTLVDDAMIITRYKVDGNVYQFAIKSNITTVSTINAPRNIVIAGNQGNFFIGNRLTLGTSNTIYTIVSMDFRTTNTITLDKDIEAGVLVGDQIAFVLTDITVQTNQYLKIASSSSKYLLNSDMYLSSYGTAFPAGGIGAKIIIKTIE